MIPKECKRLAGVDFSISVISRHSAREKSIGHRCLLNIVYTLYWLLLLTQKERRVAEDHRDCYWLYIVTDSNSNPVLQEPIKDPARLDWNEVKKVAHYWLEVNALKDPTTVKEDASPYGASTDNDTK